MMPEMSGTALMREARRRVPALRVVLMTGYADDLLSGIAADEAPDALLPKPFHGRELIALVQEIMARPRAREPLARQVTTGTFTA
jgi:two-component system cell cycle sensor histidine kinase/response regulator CckA